MGLIASFLPPYGIPVRTKGSGYQKSNCQICRFGGKGGTDHATGQQALQVAALPPGKGSPREDRCFPFLSRPQSEGSLSPISPACRAPQHSATLTSVPRLHGDFLPDPQRKPPPWDPGVHCSVHPEARGRAQSSTDLLPLCLQPLRVRRTRAQPSWTPGSTSRQALRNPGRLQEHLEAAGTKTRRPKCEVELQLPESSARHGASLDAASQRIPRYSS